MCVSFHRSVRRIDNTAIYTIGVNLFETSSRKVISLRVRSID